MDPTQYETLLNYKCSGKYPENITKAEKYVIRRRAHQFVVQEGALFYVRHKDTEKELNVKVVRGAEEAERIFKEFHASKAGSHSGRKITIDSVSNRYYWPGMTVDIEKWTKQCSVCQENRPVNLHEVYTPVIVNEPWELVGMDVIGKLSTTSIGNQYICVFIDYFTKWVEAYPLASKTAEEVTTCIVKMFYRFGAPKRILTDQGWEFANQINKEIGELFGIKRSLCSPYHPQTSGLVEQMNSIIQKTLGKLCVDKPQTWDENLDEVLFNIRTKKQLTSQYSPFYLMFGREARYFSEVPESFNVKQSVEDVLQAEIIRPSTQMQDQIYEAVKKNMQASMDKIKAKKHASRTGTFVLGKKICRRKIKSEERTGENLEC